MFATIMVIFCGNPSLPRQEGLQGSDMFPSGATMGQEFPRTILAAPETEINHTVQHSGEEKWGHLDVQVLDDALGLVHVPTRRAQHLNLCLPEHIFIH